MKLLRFGSYTFPDTGRAASRNFADIVPQSVRLPGLDGGFDEFGREAAPSEIGNIRADLIIDEPNPIAMQRERDALNGLARLGVQRLYLDMLDGSVRWTWARVNSIQMSDTYSRMTRAVLPVSINFQVVAPRLWTDAAGDAVWGAGATWGGGLRWGGGVGVAQLCSGASTSISAANNGNAIAYPTIYISTGTGQTTQNPTLLRTDGLGGAVVESIAIVGTFGAHTTIKIDVARKLAYRQGADAYSLLVARTGDWLTLPPGGNALVLAQQAGNDCTVRLRYQDSWY